MADLLILIIKKLSEHRLQDTQKTFYDKLCENRQSRNFDETKNTEIKFSK